MRLGVNLGYWEAASNTANLALARHADRLGFSLCLASEAFGPDAATVLAWVAAHTEHICVGSAVFQIPARTPALTAMTAATLDSLTGGRFVLGLGVSGPQVSEGWHGVRFADPLGRTEEYVAIVRQVLSRRRLSYSGRHFQLPLPDGPGKELQLAIAPSGAEIPVYLAAAGPRNLRLAGRIADGWLATFFSPGCAAEQLAEVEAGRKEAGKELSGFDVVAAVPIAVHEDVERAAEAVSWYASFYLGGMGSREQNFYHQIATRMGFGRAADQVQDLYLARNYPAAARAVPFEFLDATSLLGPPDRIARRMRQFAAAGVTTLTLSPFAADLDGRLAVLEAGRDAWRMAGLSG